MKSLRFLEILLWSIMLWETNLQSSQSQQCRQSKVLQKKANSISREQILRSELLLHKSKIRSSTCNQVQCAVVRGTAVATHLIFFPAFGKVFTAPEAPFLLRLCAAIPGACPTIALCYSGREQCKRYMKCYDSLLKLKYQAQYARQQQHKTGYCLARDCQLSASLEWFLEKGGYDEMHRALLDELFSYTNKNAMV